ncbi:GNAT family acetyltransferase [Eubacterium limosum]|nr:GNAT family acetyltransferase [Eubacterium limosum]
MEIKLRCEQTKDYRETEAVTREAFWNHYAPGCFEHYLVHVMRDSPAFLPGLAFVALDGDKIIGNVMCVKSIIQGDDGKACEVLTLGPISVLPEYQKKGIGGRMLRQVRAKARKMGYRAILLYGDPDYYTKQGFVPAENYNIRTADNMYAAALQVCELRVHALEGVQGRFIEDTVYDISETKAEAFDRQFPFKEKCSGTPSQQKFEKIVRMRRKAD